jgi:uncharacterized membrane protein YheB (UPF0754 family)
MKIKKIKAVRFPKSSDPLARALGSVIIVLNDNLLLLAAGHNELKSDLKEVRRVQKIHTETIGKLAEDMTEVKEELSKKADKSDLADKADKQDIEDIKEELRKKADKKDLVSLVSRVTALETAR